MTLFPFTQPLLLSLDLWALSRLERAKRYERIKLLADIALWVAEAILLTLFIFSGWSLLLRHFLDRWAMGSPLLLVALYVMALGIIDEAIFFFPRWWRRYHLSRIYGLSVQNFRQWLLDYVKEKALGGVLLLVIIEIVFLLLRQWPQNWWIASSILISALMVFLAQVAPLIIFPLFFKFKPLQDEDLKQRLIHLAEKAGVKLEKIEEVNLSTKTRAANAALAGMGRTRRIILGDTLLNNFTHDEIEAVIAHELGHYIHGHLWKRMATQVGMIFLFLWLIDLSLRYFAVQLGYDGPADAAAIPLMALISTIAGLFVLPPVNAQMRHFERQADRYAIEASGKPWALISTLERLARMNLADPNPHPVVEALFRSHPSIGRRIVLCRKWAEQLGLPLMPPPALASTPYQDVGSPEAQ